jgi:AsmA protein
MHWIVRLIGLVVVLIVVALVALLLLPAERIARIAADQIEAATGRSVTIGGPVSLSYWPVLGARVERLEVGNAEWSDQGPMFEAASVSIGVDARALVGGKILISEIDAQSPVIRLETRTDGQANWILGPDISGADAQQALASSTPTPQPGNTSPPATIEALKIANASVLYAAEGQKPLLHNGIDLTLDWPEGRGAAQVYAIFSPAATPVEITATIDALESFLSGDVHGVAARLATTAGTIDFDGRASLDGSLEGSLAVQSANTREFLGAFGAGDIDLPPRLGRSLNLRAMTTLTPDGRLALRDLDIDLGGNRVTGTADVLFGDVPQVNAGLDLGALDLSGLGDGTPAAPSAVPAPKGVATKAEPAQAGGWPRDTIDASALASFNGEIAVSARSINLGGFSVGGTQAVLRNDTSRMVFDLREVLAYGGVVAGEFVINNRGGLSVGGRLTATGIEMQPLLRDAADLSRLTGKADARLSFLGSGPSVDAIMKSLSGDGGLSIGRGTIEGINLDRLMQSGDVGDGTTIFDNMSATWTMAAGVLTNRDLLFELKNYRASGEGVVGLGAQTINYRFTPVALRANSGQGLAVPVIIKGPWSDVSIRPDLEAVLDARIEEEKQELERKAKEKLQEKLGKELGVTPAEGQSVEDALKDKLLRRLFE